MLTSWWLILFWVSKIHISYILFKNKLDTYDRMNIACEECSFKSSCQSIDNDAYRNEEACGVNIYSSEGIHHGRATKQ